MDQRKEVQVSGQVVDDREEFLVDRDRNVCDPFLSVGSVSDSKERLWYHYSQGNDVLNVCRSFLNYFAIEQTLHFPEFAEWCASNYSPSQRVIVSRSASKVLCRVDAVVIREVLSLPKNYVDSREVINESILVELYKKSEAETRSKFLSSVLKDG